MRKTDLPFLKMHGLGNDFLVLDGRDGSVMPNADQMRQMADRRKGLGCDQIMIMMPATKGADVQLDMFNADGSIAGACGNGSRCVASLLMKELNKKQVTIDTISGHLQASLQEDTGLIQINMGPIRTAWQDVPLSQPADTLHVDLGFDSLGLATCLSVGNPHAVFFCEDAETVDVEKWGPLAEQHGLFPDRANIEFVSVLSQDEIRMRVWERGTGITLACGSGACAAAAASILHGRTKSSVKVHLDGGVLQIDWPETDQTNDRQIYMTGPVSLVAKGIIPACFLTAGSDQENAL